MASGRHSDVCVRVEGEAAGPPALPPTPGSVPTPAAPSSPTVDGAGGGATFAVITRTAFSNICARATTQVVGRLGSLAAASRSR